MPRTAKIEWNGFSRGEDSASAALDPLSPANGYCAYLANIEPSGGRLKPRPGSRKVSQPKNVWWMGEYQKSSGGYALILDAGDLKSVSFSGTITTVYENWLNSPREISSVRVGKYLILLTDSDGDSLVISERGGVLYAFSAYMRNESPAITSMSTEVVEDGGASWSGRGDYTLDNKPATVGGYDVSSPRNATFTWIRLESQDGEQFDLDKGMPGAQLESWENIATRTAAAYCPVTVDAVGVGGFMGNINFTFDPSAVPAGATHLRLYMTLPGTIASGNYLNAQLIADGLVYRWAADIPVGALSSNFTLPGSDGALAGSVNLCWSTGRDDLPAGGSIKFFDGRLWVYGGKSEANPGRSYFSAVIDGATEQLSKLLSFRYDTDFKDTSTDETEPGVGMGISHGMLILFNSRSVYSLRGADYSPEPLDMTRGAIGGITEIGQRIFYLSQEGPAVVSGSSIDNVENFKSDMTTPGIIGYSAFFDPGARIRGMWHNHSWMLTDGQRVACYKMGDNADGTWRLIPGETMSFSFSCSPTKGELWVGGEDKPIYSLMDKSRTKDGDTPFLCRLATNATPVPQGMISGEAYRIWTWTRWTDNSQLKIVLLGDHGRVADLYQFKEDETSGASTGHTMGQRGQVMQVVRAGALSHWFQIELEKYSWNQEILFGPIMLELFARNWHPESVSMSEAGRAEPILDAGMLTWDPETTEL